MPGIVGQIPADIGGLPVDLEQSKGPRLVDATIFSAIHVATPVTFSDSCYAQISQFITVITRIYQPTYYAGSYGRSMPCL